METKKDKYSESKKRWRQANSEKRSIYLRDWHRRNPHKKAEYRKKYSQTTIWKLNNRMRTRMNQVLLGLKNFKKWESIVGYSVADLEKHIESKFTEGMDWEQFMRGKIHIDHILPISFFGYDSETDEEFKRCWSLDNLQPLWAKDNLSKSNKIPAKLIF